MKGNNAVKGSRKKHQVAVGLEALCRYIQML